MRSLHANIKSEYGKESVLNLRQWEKLEMKMANFKNHRRFTLRCLSQGLVPVSIKLKTNVKTPKGTYIVKKAEKMLMNERVRVINNSITIFNCQIDTCINLERLLERGVLEECHRFIEERRKERHINTQKRQIDKFNRLWQQNTGSHSNLHHGRNGENRSDNVKQSKERVEHTEKEQQQHPKVTQVPEKKWVHNLTNNALTEAQEKVLAHGPNFVGSHQPTTNR